jgi:hypothetical protein
MGHTLICQKLLLVGNHNVPFAECASAMRLVEKAACFFCGNETQELTCSHNVIIYVPDICI